MTLARSLPDSTTEWWVFLGAVALYVFTRWALTWHQARRDGDRHPVRAAFADEDLVEDPAKVNATLTSGGFRSYRQFFGAATAAVVVAAIIALTEDRLRVTLLCTIGPVLVTGLAYVDFRHARQARQGRQARHARPPRNARA
jgi:Flp pilus assembly protein TadB